MFEPMPRRGVLPAAAAVFVLACVPVAQARHWSFQTGVYSAKTSQQTTFKFKIVGHTAASHCGTKGTQHCFIALSDPRLDETCADGTAYSAGLFDVPSGFVTPTGNFSYHQALSDTNPRIDFRAHAEGTRVNGTFRETDPQSGPTGMLSCDSGSVTFTARKL
jgi:hypothetical protein